MEEVKEHVVRGRVLGITDTCSVLTYRCSLRGPIGKLTQDEVTR